MTGIVRAACRGAGRSPWPGLAVLTLVFLWAYWPTLRVLLGRWSSDPQYSHGYLVPVFAGILLAVRWQRGPRLVSHTNWWGVVLLVAATGLRLAGAYLYFDWFDALSLLPCLAGLFLLLGGWPMLRWSWPAVAFLVFMIPLPYQAELTLTYPLQRLATGISTYSLQTLGYPALAEGNVIVMGPVKVGVEAACSGLSMLFVLLALALAVALVFERPLWQRLVLVLCAVPIAVGANVARITFTGVLYQTAGREAGDLGHSRAGWFMMPLALGLLWLELSFLARLFIKVSPPCALPLRFADTRKEGFVSPETSSPSGARRHDRRPDEPLLLR